MKSPLRKAYENEVKKIRRNITDAELDALSKDELIAIINHSHDEVKKNLADALNEFEDCLTVSGCDKIWHDNPHLQYHSAFIKAHEICKENLINPKL